MLEVKFISMDDMKKCIPVWCHIQVQGAMGNTKESLISEQEEWLDSTLNMTLKIQRHDIARINVYYC